MKIKKMIAALLVATLTLTVGMTTFAAPSITGGIQGGGPAKSENGADLDVTVKDPLADGSLPMEVKEELSNLISDDTREEAKKKALEEARVVVPEGSEANVLGVVDINITGLESGDTALIDVEVPSAKLGDHIVVLHYNLETGVWEAIPAEVIADGQVRLTITSASPFAFMVIAAVDTGNEKVDVTSPTQTDGNADKKDVKSTIVKSPKTGESAMVILLGAIALLAAGSAYSLKKRA